MSKAAFNSITGRHLCCLGLPLRASHPKHCSTIANAADNTRLSQQPPGLTAPPVPTKSYSEVPSPAGYPLFGTLPRFLAAGGIQYHHKYVSQLHKELGGVFRDNLAGMELVFVADQTAVREVFDAEGQHPRHFIPEAWLLYNEERQARRGLFFM